MLVARVAHAGTLTKKGAIWPGGTLLVQEMPRVNPMGTGTVFWKTKRRSVLANNLGENWNQSWTATGFPDLSTAVPATQAKRQALLLSLKNFFAANPGYEVNTPKLVVTSAK